MFFCFRKSEEFVNSGRWYQLAAVSTTDGYEWMNEELNFFNGPHIRSLAYPCTVDFSQSTYLLSSGHEFGKEGLIIFKENVEF
jgi:hypothetical protein